MLNKLNNKNLYLYWLLIEKNDVNALENSKESLEQILEYYKNQIAKMYMLNLVEQNILNDKNTQLNLVIQSLINKLNDNQIMDEYIVNGLCLSNLDTIFNDKDFNFDYTLVSTSTVADKIRNNKYIRTSLEYANSFCTKPKIKKKIPNFV